MEHYGIFTAHYAPHVGGVETFTQELARELVHEGNRVTIVASDNMAVGPHETQVDGVKVVRLPCWPLMNARMPIPRRNALYRGLVDELLGSDISRIVVNTRFYLHSLEGVRLAASKGVPSLVIDHGSDYIGLGNPVADKLIRMHEHFITRRLESLDARFAGVSTKSTEWLETFGIHTDVVVSNAIDADAYRRLSTGRDFRAELGLSVHDVMVVFVGRLIPEKGILPLVEAMDLLDECYTLVVAGDGPLGASMERCSKRVHWIGEISKPDVSALLSQADVFCLPSRSEGFCLAFVEAASWGVPLAVTRVGCAESLLSVPQRCGAFIENVDGPSIADAIRKAHASTKDSRELLIRRVEEQYSWKSSARQLDQAFL